MHYLKDAQRGVVWEETLILLAGTGARFVFLSATIPNSVEFRYSAESACLFTTAVVRLLQTVPLKTNALSPADCCLLTVPVRGWPAPTGTGTSASTMPPFLPPSYVCPQLTQASLSQVPRGVNPSHTFPCDAIPL